MNFDTVSFKEWAKLTQVRVQRRALRVSTPEELQRGGSGAVPLPRCMGWLDLLLLGIGAVIGAGVFVLTGVAAHDHAGPSVMLSYIIAGCAAMLAGLCYVEFVVEQPITGGAFNYISLTFGELTAWIVASNMILEYTLSCAAVARGFSAYFATLLGFAPSAFILRAGPLQIDFLALALICALSVLLAMGTRESSQFNNVVTSTNLVVIAYVLLASLPQAKLHNLQPFFSHGLRGTFTAASVVFFSYVGFDTIATVAEEVHEPGKDLPIGIVGTVGVCTLLYALMGLAISAMVPAPAIDISAPFSDAFLSVLHQSGGWGVRSVLLATSARFVSFGALTGIVTSLLTSLMGQARIYVALGRHHLLPPGLAKVHPGRNTPINATIVTGVSSGVLALLVDLEVLAELVSIGTLFVFCMVAAGLLWRRYKEPHTSSMRGIPLRLAAIAVFSLALSISYTARGPWVLVLVMALLWLGAVVSLLPLPVAFRPAAFQVPLTPFTPALAMLSTIHLIGSLGWPAYVRFAVWLILSLVVYMVYGVHHAEAKSQADLARLDIAVDEGPEEGASLYTTVPSDVEGAALALAGPHKAGAPASAEISVFSLHEDEDEPAEAAPPSPQHATNGKPA